MSNRSMARKRPLLKLVHRGGLVETYDRPITAAEIMNKYPRHCVTRPDVFMYPWLVVRPQSVLQPGDVFYVVPYNTIRHLMRSKQCPEQQAHPGEAARSGLDERNNLKFSDEARSNPRGREKIDLPGWLFVKEDVQSRSFDESLVEVPSSHQLVRGYSPDGDTSVESRKLRENGPGDLISVYPYDRRSGVKTPRRQPSYALQPQDPYGSSAEITQIHQLTHITESCSQCKAEREDTRGRVHGVTISKKHSADQFIEARSAGDFTFHRTNEDPKYIEESSPDMSPFLCLPKRDARKGMENYKSGEHGRRGPALKYPLNVTDHSKEMAPKNQNNDSFVNNGSHSPHRRRPSGNGYRRNESTADGTKDRNLVLGTRGTDSCDSQGGSTEPKPCTMKSCIKKSGLKLFNRRVQFNYPGENEKKLIVEVFEYQRSDSPNHREASCLPTF